MSKIDFEQQRHEIVRRISSGEISSADGLRQLGFLARLEAFEKTQRTPAALSLDCVETK